LNVKGGRVKGGQENDKKGRSLFKGNASPTVPGAFELEDRKQALLLCACPRLLQEKVCTKRWAGNQQKEEFSLRAMHPQQYRELSNSKIENRRNCNMDKRI
jgi:hypothetical protein